MREVKVGERFPLAYSHSIGLKQGGRWMVEATGEFWCPRDGEWFITDWIGKDIGEGYLADHDLSTEHWIGILVKEVFGKSEADEIVGEED